jgi:hypothetical protein
VAFRSWYGLVGPVPVKGFPCAASPTVLAHLLGAVCINKSHAGVPTLNGIRFKRPKGGSWPKAEWQLTGEELEKLSFVTLLSAYGYRSSEAMGKEVGDGTITASDQLQWKI